MVNNTLYSPVLNLAHPLYLTLYTPVLNLVINPVLGKKPQKIEPGGGYWLDTPSSSSKIGQRYTGYPKNPGLIASLANPRALANTGSYITVAFGNCRSSMDDIASAPPPVNKMLYA